MVHASKQLENQAFADRLREALKGAGVRPSPTLVAHEFNLRYWGKSITSHTARSWLLGKSIPMQDRLRVLADWLHVSPDALRFGTLVPSLKSPDGAQEQAAMSMQDRDMLARYLALPPAEQKTVRDVVAALSIAATSKGKK